MEDAGLEEDEATYTQVLTGKKTKSGSSLRSE
jgi:hypothetical protein